MENHTTCLSHLVVWELETRLMSYLDCLFPMIYIQFATLCCPYVHALFHQGYQRQQIERSEWIDLGTAIWFLHGKGNCGFFCLNLFLAPVGQWLVLKRCSHLYPWITFHPSQVLSGKPVIPYVLCSKKTNGQRKDPRLARSTFTRQGVGWGAVTPECKHGSRWPRYRMPNAGVEGMSKLGIGFCPFPLSATPLFWFPFRIKAQTWFMEGGPALPTTSSISSACCCYWFNPAFTVHHPSADEPPWDASRLSVFAHTFPWLLGQ